MPSGTYSNNLFLSHMMLTALPDWMQYIKVNGNVYLDNNNLTSLKNCPHTVQSFWCAFNRLNGDLTGGPTNEDSKPIVIYDCSYNQITSLKGAPKTVKGAFWFNSNRVTKLAYLPSIGNNQSIGTKAGNYNGDHNPGNFTKTAYDNHFND